MSFETHPEGLGDLLTSAGSGQLQLPDFQRDYVWEDAAVRSLVASVARGFPVGALLTLVTGGDVRFKPRLVEGAPGGEAPAHLLLDGQQRITSLFQALWSREPVRTRRADGKVVERHYYLDMQAVADGVDMEACILSVPVDRITRRDFGREVVLDLTDPGLEVAAGMFPLDRTFEPETWWDRWNDDRPKEDRPVRDRVREVIAGIKAYRMPVIRLTRETSREAVCGIFEKVNMGGVKLDAFELVTAMYAAGEYDLRAEWARRRDEMKALDPLRAAVLVHKDAWRSVQPTEFLQVAAFLHTREQRAAAAAAGKEGRALPQVSLQRPSLLSLPQDSFQGRADAVTKGFAMAAGFLNGQRIVSARDLPYLPIRTALAALFASREGRPLSAAESRKVADWLWSVSLGEQYGSATETKIARDVTELIEWLSGGDVARAVSEATFYHDRLDRLTGRISAAYKAMHALMMARGARDFWTGTPAEVMTVQAVNMDVHHVFPSKWCADNGFTDRWVDSIVNKTPLSAETNRAIGGAAPSIYLRRIEDRQGIEPQALDDILRTHLIEPETLRADDFGAFYDARRRALTELVAGVLHQGALRAEDDEPDAEREAA